MTDEQATLLEWADEDLRAAEAMAEMGALRAAVSRAYYSMYSAARALLLEVGQSFSSHSAVIGAFGKHLAKPEVVPTHLHRYLIDTQDDRLDADYRTGRETTQGDADEALSRAQEFLRIAEGMLGPAPDPDQESP